jgi:hypothetical protein
MTDQTVTEAQATTSRMTLVTKLLAKADEMAKWLESDLHAHASPAEVKAVETERDQIIARVAELMVKYGIDQAMLVSQGQGTDPILDEVIWTDRPFSNRFHDLLYYLVEAHGARSKSIKQHTGVERKGALKWRYGLRVFAHASDMETIRVMYTLGRNQALAGASRIKGEHKFGQDQKAHRESFVEGFTHGVWSQVNQARREAKRLAEIEAQERADQAMTEGKSAGQSVELVLADRSAAVRAAYELAVNGRSREDLARIDAQMAKNRERWAEMDRKADERRAARIAEQNACTKCKAAKSGYCNDHRDMRPSTAQPRTYERVGNYYSDGYYAGRSADLGQTRTQVTNKGQTAIS